jgi:hypothetical protein
MTDKIKQAQVQHREIAKKEAKTEAGVDDLMVNDSLGTVTIADSTGTDEAKETGDSKRGNKDTRED